MKTTLPLKGLGFTSECAPDVEEAYEAAVGQLWVNKQTTKCKMEHEQWIFDKIWPRCLPLNGHRLSRRHVKADVGQLWVNKKKAKII